MAKQPGPFSSKRPPKLEEPKSRAEPLPEWLNADVVERPEDFVIPLRPKDSPYKRRGKS